MVRIKALLVFLCHLKDLLLLDFHLALVLYTGNQFYLIMVFIQFLNLLDGFAHYCQQFIFSLYFLDPQPSRNTLLNGYLYSNRSFICHCR